MWKSCATDCIILVHGTKIMFSGLTYLNVLAMQLICLGVKALNQDLKSRSTALTEMWKNDLIAINLKLLCVACFYTCIYFVLLPTYRQMDEHGRKPTNSLFTLRMSVKKHCLASGRNHTHHGQTVCQKLSSMRKQKIRALRSRIFMPQAGEKSEKKSSVVFSVTKLNVT